MREVSCQDGPIQICAALITCWRLHVTVGHRYGRHRQLVIDINSIHLPALVSHAMKYRNLIDVLQRYSSALAFLKPVVLALIVGSVLFAAYTVVVLAEQGNDHFLMPSIVTFIWCVTLYAMLIGFPNVPVAPSKEMSVFKRFNVRVKRFGYHLLGFTFFAVSLAALYVGYILLKIWIVSS